MTKLAQDFEMWSGDHKNLIFSVTDTSTGGAASLTGASVAWVLAEGPMGGSLVRLTTDDGVAVSGSVFTVSLSPAHTAGLSGTYYHEAQVRDSSSNVSTVAVGTVKINYDVAG